MPRLGASRSIGSIGRGSIGSGDGGRAGCDECSVLVGTFAGQVPQPPEGIRPSSSCECQTVEGFGLTWVFRKCEPAANSLGSTVSATIVNPWLNISRHVLGAAWLCAGPRAVRAAAEVHQHSTAAPHRTARSSLSRPKDLNVSCDAGHGDGKRPAKQFRAVQSD